MKWRLREDITTEKINELASQLNIEPLVAKILLNRGFDYDEARIATSDIHEAILEPELLTNAKKAADIITDYCNDEKSMIWIFADYDCDGIDAGYVMADALREVAKCCVSVYYPERSEGYGLNMNFCKRVVDNCGEKTLVLTVDNGITCVEEIAYLKANGIEVIVTDHHVAKEVVPDCLIVDPHNTDEPDTFKHLSGCGVAFKVAQLVKYNYGQYDMLKYTPYVAVATLADVMPLALENIAFIKYGLNIINSDLCPEGFKLLKKYIGKETLTSIDLVWDIAPRINACGRMGNTSLGADLLFASKNIEEVVLAIEKLNTERKGYSDKAKKFIETLDFSNHKVCIIDATEYPEGVIGIIAGKATEKFGKPSIVIGGKETMVGSARSIEGIDLQIVLQAELEKGNIVEFGGHSAAAGVTIKRDMIAKLQSSLDEVIVIPEPVANEEKELEVDEVITLSSMTESTYRTINEIPYDNKTISAPVFALLDVEVLETTCSKNNPNNIKFKLRDGKVIRTIWAWGMAPLYNEIGKPNKIHLAGQIERDFMNVKNLTFKVMDFMGA
jgi:single-stranded-DNA-specific exonuclease